MIQPKSSYYQLPFLGGFPFQLEVCSWILSCSYGLATEESWNLHSFCLQVPNTLNDTHSTNVFSCLKSKVGIGSFHYTYYLVYTLFGHISKVDPQIAATNTCATNKRNTWHKNGLSNVHNKRLVSATGAPSLGSTVFTAVLGAFWLAFQESHGKEWRNNGGHIDVFNEVQRKWHKSKVIYCSWNEGATLRSTNIAGSKNPTFEPF